MLKPLGRICLVFLLAFAATAEANDFSTGLAAYKAGNYDAALATWLPLARAGNTRAMHNIALMYRKGIGVKKDVKKSFTYFKYAARKGFHLSQFQIGRMYERGQGTPRNTKEAMRWMQKSAVANNPRAQFLVAIWYDRGIGAARDPVKSLTWHLIASVYAKGKLKKKVDESRKKLQEYLSSRHVSVAYTAYKKYLIEDRLND